MNDKNQALSKVLDILSDWDPIGVGGEFSDDEYRRYAIRIVRMMEQGCDQYRLKQWLGDIRTVAMGLLDSRAASEIDRDVARRLIETRDEIQP